MPKPVYRDPAMAGLMAFARMVKKHEDCTWEQVGRCVYCADHGCRMYQGSIPPGQNSIARTRTFERNAAAGAKMRERWNKQ